MRITYKGDYALKTILDLALHYNQGLVNIQDLAQRADIPVKFLEQVLLGLKQGGFVDSKRGVKGGYFLARQPKDIKIGDVVRFIDGPIEPIACVEKRYSGCNDVYKCSFRRIWQEVAEGISNVIDNITFEDLVHQLKKQKEVLVYQI